MSEPKRYDLITTVSAGRFSQSDLVESKDGNLVSYEDYARLKAEVERLTQLNDTLALRYDATNSMLDGCAKEIEGMEAEVERLTKAGDAYSDAMDRLAMFANEDARLMARTASLAFKDALNASKGVQS